MSKQPSGPAKSHDDGRRSPVDPVLAGVPQLLPDLEKLYRDVHSHPELSMQETRTARIAAKHLKSSGFEVTTGIGQTGVVGVLHNGDGNGDAARGHGRLANPGSDWPSLRK
jgi:hypothetical protein